MKEKKLEAMADGHFKGMVWMYKVCDLFWSSKRRLKKIPLREGMRVVGYGCGPGRYTLPIAKLIGPEGKVFAVDIQPLAIKTVKKKTARQGLGNVEAELVDSYDTGIPGATIDLVLLIDILHMIKNRDALFHEIHRLLKPEGLLFVTPEHMKLSRAKEILESSSLFTVTEYRDRDMIVAPEVQQ